ncbi:unnamed protein product [Nippostrongylus brasiliensis]|uniref:Metalloendopeptidase n=1 Tax=Nippostrongylus brasiliensis TaxID=27835 RepID=A0A0N4YAF7_NIPBR|nr:unnamed protein product [Nippostrongylus brasiliensis]
MIGSSLGIGSLFVICGNVLGLTRTTLSRPFSGDDIQSGDLLWRLAQLSRSDSSPLTLNSMSMQFLASLDNDDEEVVDTRSILEINQEEGVDSYLLEGDIRLSSEQLNRLERNLNETRQKRQADKTVALWTNNQIFYYFDDSVGPRRRRLVRKTLAYLSARTCLDFVENSTYTNRIRVFFGNGCYSSIGMTGGEQDLSLGKGCYTMGTVAHEFMHALGVWHMHMRDDRDDYISVDLSGVPVRFFSYFINYFNG